MKDLGKTKFCLGLQIKHFPNGVLIHQSTYIKKVLKLFYMDKTHPLGSPMVVRSLDVKKTHFVIAKNMKNYFVLKYHILVLLVHLCIQPIVHVQRLFFLSIYQQDTIPLQLEDIGMVSNIYCVIFAELLILVYFTQGNQSNNYLDMQMQDIFQIYTKIGHKRVCVSL